MNRSISDKTLTQQRLIDFLQQAFPIDMGEILDSLSKNNYNYQRSQQQVIELLSIQDMLSNQYQRSLDLIEQQKQDLQQQIQERQRLQGLAQGIWLDTQQPLMWCLCALGESVEHFCLSGHPIPYSFKAAQAACEDLSFAGFQDWKLPSIHQLKRLHRQSLPALLLTERAFDAAIWSATDNTKNTNNIKSKGTGAWLWQQGKPILHPRKSDKFCVLAMRRVKANDFEKLSNQ